MANYYIVEFKSVKYRYCDISEFTYWIMTDDINESRIINRVPKV